MAPSTSFVKGGDLGRSAAAAVAAAVAVAAAASARVVVKGETE